MPTPGNSDWQHDLAVSFDKIASAQRALHYLTGALASYRASHSIFDRLAKADPGTAGWQSDLAYAENSIGEVQFMQRNLTGALASFQDSLVKADPRNAVWQRDLAKSYEHLGMVYAVRGNRDDALRVSRQGREIIEKLMKLSPYNASLPKDLLFLDGQIGQLEK